MICHISLWGLVFLVFCLFLVMHTLFSVHILMPRNNGHFTCFFILYACNFYKCLIVLSHWMNASGLVPLPCLQSLKKRFQCSYIICILVRFSGGGWTSVPCKIDKVFFLPIPNFLRSCIIIYSSSSSSSNINTGISSSVSFEFCQNFFSESLEMIIKPYSLPRL